MNYYLEKISMKQAQLEIAKVGLTQATSNYAQEVQNAIVMEDNAYEAVNEMAKKVNAGIALVKEIEEDIKYYKKEYEKEKAKAENGEGNE